MESNCSLWACIPHKVLLQGDMSLVGQPAFASRCALPVAHCGVQLLLCGWSRATHRVLGYALNRTLRHAQCAVRCALVHELRSCRWWQQCLSVAGLFKRVPLSSVPVGNYRDTVDCRAMIDLLPCSVLAPWGGWAAVRDERV
jgi:hypothetical protein